MSVRLLAVLGVLVGRCIIIIIIIIFFLFIFFMVLFYYLIIVIIIIIKSQSCLKLFQMISEIRFLI